MLRKTIFAIAASAALAAAALSPNTASAREGGGHGGIHGDRGGGWGHPHMYAGLGHGRNCPVGVCGPPPPHHRWPWWPHRFAFRFYGGAPGYGGCLVRQWVQTPDGPVLRWINVCN